MAVAAPANRGKTYPGDHLRRSEIDALLETLEARGTLSAARDRALLIVLWRAGLRISEALDLRPFDVDLERGTIRVLHGKGDRARTVGLDREACGEISRWLELRRAWDLPPDAPLFSNRHGGRMDPATIRQLLPRLARRAGVFRRVHPHIFRHTYAVELVSEGVPIPHIQRLLGHRRLSVTEEYLVSLAPEDALRSVRDRAW